MIFETGMLSIIVPITRMSGRLDNFKTEIAKILDRNVQVVLIHDNHDDETGRELSLFKNSLTTSNLILIEGQYGSPGMARNAGLKEANGMFVTFWDSDDEPQVEKYLEFAEKTISKDFDLGISGFTIKNTIGDVCEYEIEKKHLELELKKIALRPGLWRFIFNRKVIENLRFSDSRMGEDQVFIAKAILNSKRIFTFRASTYQYLIGNEGQLTQDKNNIRFIVQSLMDVSDIDIRNLDRNKKNFIALIYWKMYLTLVKNYKNRSADFSYLEHMKSLREENRELFRLVLIQFGLIRNYWRLR